MSTLRVEIRSADGRKAVTHVDGERLLIGSGAHCDVRLPLDQAASEHVAIQVVGGTVRAESKASEPPATVNGVAFTSIPLAPDVPLKIGSTLLFVALGDFALDGAPLVRAQKKEGMSPLMKVLGVGVLLAGGYLVLDWDTATVAMAPTRAPELFAPAPATCPQAAADQARSFAAEKFDIAEGKRERSPFAPKDGVQAVLLYDTARVCFEQAGDQASAAEADSAAKQLRASLTQDFRARRVRLEHLMAIGDYELAKNDVRVLRSLTEGKQGPWVNWLAAANQTVKQKAGPR